MAAARIQKLYTVAALVATGTILIWIKVMDQRPVGVDINHFAPAFSSEINRISKTTSHDDKEHLPQLRKLTEIPTKSRKITNMKDVKDVCRKHKYTVDSSLPRFLNCTNLFKGSPIERNKVKYGQKQKKWKVPFDSAFYRQALNCNWIHKQMTVNYYVSEEEKQFPLAFALNVYQSPYQIFRFLKVIYRPHNLYCIHYDKKSDKLFKKLINTMARCLPNVIVPQKIEDVVWAWHTIVDAQMNCLNDLYELRQQYPWQYAITLCGKEVPLRTNREMVNTLQKLNGTSAVDLENNKDFEYVYWKYEHNLENNIIQRTNKTLGPIPFNLTITKSMAYFGLSTKFVSFLLHNEKAKKFRDFMDKTYIPDEHFIATLYNAKDVPGGRNDKFSHLVPTTSSYVWLLSSFNTFVPWKSRICQGIDVHSICILTSSDIHLLDYTYDPHKDHQTFFHNKFFIERDRVVMDCAEEELLRRNREECLRDTE